MDPINNATAPAKPGIFVKVARIIAAIVAVIFIVLDCKILAELWENRDKTPNNPLEPYRSIVMVQGFRCALVLSIVTFLALVVLIITRKIAMTLFFPILALVQNCAYYIALGRYDESASELLFWQKEKDKPWAYGPNSAFEWIQNAKRMQLLVIFLLLLFLFLIILNIRKGWRWPLLICVLIGFCLIEAEGTVLDNIKRLNEADFVSVGNYLFYAIAIFLYSLVYPKKKNRG